VPSEYERIYTRHLPHHHLAGATFFVTTRLYGSIPQYQRLALVEEAKRLAARLAEIADEKERTRAARALSGSTKATITG